MLMIPDKILRKNRNIAAVYELYLTATITTACQVATTGQLETRTQAINAAESIAKMFSDITVILDANQEQFENLDLDFQYFSQSQAWQDLSLLVATTTNYLLQASFELAVEKFIVLRRPMTPADITVQEYGTHGEDDSNLTLFIDSNKLKGNDILLLPAGREVVVYVS